MPLEGIGLPVGVYPQEYGYAFGFPALPSSTDARFATEQYETVSAGQHSVTVSPGLMTGSRGYTARQCTWQTQFSGTPTGPSIVLEGSIDDVNWTTVDTSSNTGGETRTVATNFQKFRITIASLTGSAAAIVKVAFM